MPLLSENQLERIVEMITKEYGTRLTSDEVTVNTISNEETEKNIKCRDEVNKVVGRCADQCGLGLTHELLGHIRGLIGEDLKSGRKYGAAD